MRRHVEARIRCIMFMNDELSQLNPYPNYPAEDRFANLDWHHKQLALSYRLGDWTIWRKWLDARVYDYGLNWVVANRTGFDIQAITSYLDDADDNVCLLRSLPIKSMLSRINHTHDHYLYVSEYYQRHYADLTLGAEAYAKTFSSKTRSTLRR